MKESYLIGNITIKDQEKWSQYRSKVSETLRPWGGELVYRGKKALVLAGNNNHTDNVVIRFQNIESLNGWFNSKDYQSLIPLRNKAAYMDLTSYHEDS